MADREKAGGTKVNNCPKCGAELRVSSTRHMEREARLLGRGDEIERLRAMLKRWVPKPWKFEAVEDSTFQRDSREVWGDGPSPPVMGPSEHCMEVSE